MKERPILFTGDMIRAILEDRKTMTRRIIKPQPELAIMDRKGTDALNACIRDGLVPSYCDNPKWRWRGTFVMPWPSVMFKWCPYGVPGDRLWVKETWCDLRGGGFENDFVYRADTLNGYGQENEYSKQCRGEYGYKWKSSRFMPRRASRILLEITNVRVERVQEISNEDAIKEGISGWSNVASPVDCFMTLWDRSSGKGAWDRNDWVWAIEFRRIK